MLPSVAAVLGVIVNFLSDLMIWIVEHIASWHIGSWDISQILIGHVPLAPIILYYCLILFVSFVYLRHPLLKKAICTTMALAIIIFLGVTKWQRTYRDDLILNCLDVGHGQAMLAQLPGKANVLFDAGSMHKSDIGRRIVGPFLDYSGINKIDAIIISHNDIDHINGIPEVVEHYDVNGVYANDAFLKAVETDPCDTAAFLDNFLRKKEKDFEINNIRDLNLNSAVKIEILWPTEQVCQNEKLGDNDKSVVSLIEFAGRKVLLCSDIEQFAQQELIRLFPNLKADIVVVPHHGLAKTLEPDFLKSLDPDILICSCDQNQYERTYPGNGMFNDDLEKTKSFYTASNGAITIHIKKYGTIKASTFAESK
jgi:competence protein ComEC